jgi:hypothetical protein
MKMCYLFLIFLIKRGLLWNRHPSSASHGWCKSWTLPYIWTQFPENSHELTTCAPPAAWPSRPEPRNLYIWAPTVWTHFTKESGQSSYYQTSSYQKPTGSQVKTTKAQLSKISAFSTQYSVKICREISKYLQTCLLSSICTRNIWLCHTYSHYFQNTS